MFKISGIDKEVYIFADCSGQLSDNNPTVLATVFYFTSQTNQLNGRFEHLKAKVPKMGIDTNTQEFEFHAADIFNKRNFWRPISDSHIAEVADSLRKAIIVPEICYSLIAIDKKSGGKSGLEKYHDFIKLQERESLKDIDKNIIDNLNTEIMKVAGKDGIGQIGDLVGALFGLTSAYIDSMGFRGLGQTRVDKEYFHAKKVWSIMFELSKITFPFIFKYNPIPNFPKYRQHGWHLGSSVTEESSVDYFGIQLADYIAYTTAHLIKGENDIASNHSILSNSELHNFFEYKGTTYATSRSRYNIPKSHRNFDSQKSANKYIFSHT